MSFMYVEFHGTFIPQVYQEGLTPSFVRYTCLTV